ncbi:MAG: lactate utilization protein [Bacillota bacterium]
MTDSRAGEAELLQAIARRLGRRHGSEGNNVPTTPGSSWWTPSASLPDPPAVMDRKSMAQRFLAELTRLGGHGLRAGSPAEAAEYVRAVAAGAQAVVWDDPLLARLGLAESLSNAGLEVTVWGSALGREEAKSLAAAARTGVTSAAWGVAETGSIVLPTGAGQGRLVSLLPPVHVALLPEERLVPSVAELFRVVARNARAGAALPSSLSLATGPSRSADIENDLTTGVHGPVEVHVVLLGPGSGDACARA